MNKALLLAMILAATPVLAKKPTFSAGVPAERLIVPGERIGPLRLDGKIDDIVKLFGPDDRERGTEPDRGIWSFSKLRRWDAVGLWVDFDPGTGNLLRISVDASDAYPWAEHATSEDVRPGSRREEVVAAMGPPEGTETSVGATSLYYDARGLRLTFIDSGPRAGTVISMRIVWPSVPRGDIFIIPGARISAVKVGMPVERALALLGRGYTRGENSPTVRSYYWPHLGLSFEESEGYVTSVQASRDSPADAARILYVTTDGLSLGSKLSDVTRVFGQSSQTRPLPGGMQAWIYDSPGVAFILDHVEIVRAIGVFRSPAGSIADFDRLIALDPNDAYAYFDRGVAYKRKGDLDRAIADYDKAIELDPRYLRAYGNRGYAYAQNGHLDRAIKDFDKAIELDPKNAAAYNNRAMAYFTAGKAAQGLEDVEKSLELLPDQEETLDTRGLIFEALGRKEEAIADFRRALAKRPNDQSIKDVLRRLGTSP